MNCNNCKNQLPENSKFCPHCGLAATDNAVKEENLSVQTPAVEEVTNQEPVASEQTAPAAQNFEYNQAPMNFSQPPMPPYAPQVEKKSKKGMIIAISSAAALVVIAAAVFAVIYLFNPFTKPVPSSIINTFSQIAEESEEISQELPIINFFDDFYEDELELDVSYSGELGTATATIQSDIEEGKLKIAADYMGISGEILMSNEHITLSIPYLLGEEVYGIASSEIPSLLSDNFGIDASSTESLDLFETVDMEVYDEIIEIFTENLSDIIEEINYEELGQTPLTINDISITADSYKISLNGEKVKTSLTKLVEEIFSNESFLNIVNNPAFTLYLDSGISTPEQMKEELLNQIDLLDTDTFSSDVLTAYIYNDRLVKLEGNDGSYLEFNPEGKILEHISFIQDSQTLILSTKFEDTVFSCEVFTNSYGYETYFSLTYDVDGTSQNFVLADAYDSYAFDVLSPSENELTISATVDGDVVDIAMKKDSLADDWFNQPTQYQSMEELLSILSMFGAW